MKLVFATNNAHKLEEIKSILGDTYQIISLNDIGFKGDIPEEKETLEGNALDKARYIKQMYGYDCFADDTGLEIEALNNRPGVYSARYGGPEKDAQQNMEKVLREMKDIENRQARFRTVIALIIEDKELYFEGIVKGRILETPKGNEGFGYDPIFEPEGYNLSFAEMPLNEKNKVSHRARAVQRLVEYLKEEI